VRASDAAGGAPFFASASRISSSRISDRGGSGVGAGCDFFKLLIARTAHVRTWYNAHDPRDVVALYPLNNDNFPVSLAVDNYQGVRNQTDEI
jgi:hypothetical protein